MERKDDNTPVTGSTGIFGHLSIKDLIAILSVAVSMTLAWGVFSTRITLLEHQIVTLKAETVNLSIDLRESQKKIAAIERQQLENHYKINELWFINRNIRDGK